jgi:ferric-dicitrate binding protein FerR (iron transport regulator)
MKEKVNWEQFIERFASNACSKEEFDQFIRLIEEDPENEGLIEQLRKQWNSAESVGKPSAIDWDAKFATLLGKENTKTPVVSIYAKDRYKIWLKWAGVAAILLLVVGYFGLFNQKNTSREISKTSNKYIQFNKDVNPGGNKAILTLGDGSNINLGGAQNGTLATQGNIKVIKSEDGQLLYYADCTNASSLVYNTISTPRGGTYQLVLSDGTKVWLNAASSLRFPTSFKGKTREVTLTGEGYFEVAKNKSMPFHVNVNNMTVEVLGTHFNVNAYGEENAISTTLLEGAVKVKKEGPSNGIPHTMLLKPGEQADLSKEGVFTMNHHADIKSITAWKDNNFEFNNTSVRDIMRQVTRWYDVEVEYMEPITPFTMTGKISRNVNLSQLMEMLKYAGLNMEIENKKIIIKNN